MSLFRFWNEVNKEGLNSFFKQLIDNISIDVVSYINRLEDGDTLTNLIVELPDLYRILLQYVLGNAIESSSKGIERLLANQSLLNSEKD